MPRPSLLLASFCLLLSCGGPRVSVSVGDVSFSREPLVFADTFVGGSRTRVLTLRNEARGPREVSLSTRAPFSTVAQTLSLAGGEAREVVVTFSPTEPGASEAPLAVMVDGTSGTVALSGLGLAWPECAADACVSATFDPLQERCIEAPLADGTGCDTGTACLEDGRCQGGTCVGKTRACDDQNACTTDACDPTAGCVHFDSSESCPAPSNPCEAALCSAATGCGAVQVQDGTRCGPADCATAQVCLSGQCVTSAVPEGSACGDESPCQPRGVCNAGTCLRPASAVLTPAWSYTPAWGGLQFDGLSDEHGNLFWLEGNVVSLVSATRDGIIRFRTQLSVPEMLVAVRRPVALSQGLVLTVTGCNELSAHRTSDGATAWTFALNEGSLSSPLSGDGFVPPDDGAKARRRLTPRIRALTLGAQGKVILTVDYVDGDNSSCERSGELAPPPAQSQLLALDLATQSVDWKRNFRTVSAPVADELGNLYFSGSAPSGGMASMRSLSPSAAARWSRAATSHPTAVSGFLLLDEAGRAYNSVTGVPLKETAFNLAPVPNHPFLESPSPLIRQGDTFFFGNSLLDVDPPDLFVRMMTGGAWRRSLTPRRYPALVQPIALEGRGFLMATADVEAPSLLATPWAPWFGPTQLFAVDATGAERFRCALPGSAPFLSGALLDRGRWFAVSRSGLADTLHAFDVPGAHASSTGWVTGGGSFQNGNRPR